MEWTILIVESRKLALQIAELDQVLFAAPTGAYLDSSPLGKSQWNHGSLAKLTNAGGLEFLLTMRAKELGNFLLGNENFGLDIVASVKGRKVEKTFLLFIFY
jgi:hypothetical protein